MALPHRALPAVPDAAATLWPVCTELRALLGGPSRDLFITRLLQGSDVLAGLVPQYAALLLAGPCKVGAGWLGQGRAGHVLWGCIGCVWLHVHCLWRCCAVLLDAIMVCSRLRWRRHCG
jgi:hypothetical protein